MDFLKKNPYPLAAYCFAGYSVLRIFSTNSVVSTLGLLAYIFLTVMLFMKRRDILMVVAAAVPSVVNLLSMLVYGTSFLGFLSFLAGLLMPAYVACFLLPQLQPYVGKYMEPLKKFWFVPAAAQAVLWVLNLFSNLITWIQWDSLELIFQVYGFFSLLMTVLSIAGNLLLCNWMVFPDGLPEAWFAPKSAQGAAPVYNANTGSYEQPAADRRDLEFNMVAHILLLLFVGSIWLYIWIYRTTKALNDIPGEENRNPVTKLLLCLFVPFYYIYWTYKSAQRIDKLAASKGIPSDISTLCLILSILIGIIPPMIMQDKMNTIAAAGSTGHAAPTYGGASAYGNAPAYSSAPAYDPAPQDVAPVYTRTAYSEDNLTNEKETYGKTPAQIPAAPQPPQLAEPAAPIELAAPAPIADDEDNETDDSASMKKFM